MECSFLWMMSSLIAICKGSESGRIKQYLEVKKEMKVASAQLPPAIIGIEKLNAKIKNYINDINNEIKTIPRLIISPKITQDEYKAFIQMEKNMDFFQEMLIFSIREVNKHVLFYIDKLRECRHLAYGNDWLWRPVHFVQNEPDWIRKGKVPNDSFTMASMMGLISDDFYRLTHDLDVIKQTMEEGHLLVSKQIDIAYVPKAEEILKKSEPLIDDEVYELVKYIEDYKNDKQSDSIIALDAQMNLYNESANFINQIGRMVRNDTPRNSVEAEFARFSAKTKELALSNELRTHYQQIKRDSDEWDSMLNNIGQFFKSSSGGNSNDSGSSPPSKTPGGNVDMIYGTFWVTATFLLFI